mgnify:CR=1 FL=1
MSISVKNVSKKFGGFSALDKVSLHIPDGNLVALLGPSGSGKTTLLRIIAGLENPDEGSVLYRDEEITSKSAKERNVGFVFQHYALFRHLTVFDNIGFGLSVRGVAKDKISLRVKELLHLIRLEGLENRYPSQLSGGQRQRVAVARALVNDPSILLADEPTGALDSVTSREVMELIQGINDEGKTILIVTHEDDIAHMTKRIVNLKDGVIIDDSIVEQVRAKQNV